MASAIGLTAAPTKIACIGDSITEGSGLAAPSTESCWLVIDAGPFNSGQLVGVPNTIPTATANRLYRLWWSE